MAEYGPSETGFFIKETVNVTRIAGAAITFETGYEYAPVMASGVTDKFASHVIMATDGAAVIGWVKKPTTKTSLATGDIVSMVIDGVIKFKSKAAVTGGAPLSVDVTSTVTTVEETAFNVTMSNATLLADMKLVLGYAVHAVEAAGGPLYIRVGK